MARCLNPLLRQVNLDGKTFFINVKGIYKSFGNKRAKEYINELQNDYYRGYIKELNVVPCRKCINCQLNRSREWSIRNMLEAQEFKKEKKIFLTLTYNDESLVINPFGLPTLFYEHFQLFMKRFRKMFGAGIRFYMCGEYGSLNLRPHYHVLIYGVDFEQLKPYWYKKNNAGQNVYISEVVNDLWKYGFNTIGAVSDFTILYVARYCTKKYHPSKKSFIIPEFNTMSRNPGIGAQYCLDNILDLYNDDQMTVKLGDKVYHMRPVKYYDHLLEQNDPCIYSSVKHNRQVFLEEQGVLSSIDYEFKTDKNFSDYLDDVARITRDKYHRNENKEVSYETITS